MLYKEVTVTTTSEASELVADILSEAGSEGVSIRDDADVRNLRADGVIWDYAPDGGEENDSVVRVSGFFSADEFDAALKSVDVGLEFLRANCPFDTGTLEIDIVETDGDDWAENWRKFYRPMSVGRVAIVPEWIDYEVAIGEVEVKIDPGMAFGTGEHESTRMCLELLSGIDVTGKRVLDAGTGSGILAVAALKLGARDADAFDIDETAVKAARQNAVLNGVEKVLNVMKGDLEACANGEYDVIIANITADVLIGISRALPRYLKDDGLIAVSGIILERERETAEAFESAGFEIVKRLAQGEWAAMLLRRANRWK